MIAVKNSVLFYGVLVAVGAASYGMLTTFVKLAEADGFNIYEVSLSEYVVGGLGIILLDFLCRQNKKYKTAYRKPSRKNIRNLMLAGGSMGVTTFVYYFSVKFISVSVAIVLLMQSVWIGVVLDAILNKVRPSALKIVAVVVVLLGTVFATNVLFSEVTIDWRGILLGFLAAISYSVTIMATNRVGLGLAPTTRSKWMAMGAFVVVLVVTLPVLVQEFHVEILYTWGLFFGMLGAVVPPVLLNYAMPKINLGVGAIITSIELPVTACLAYIILNETINAYQWLGIVLILIAIVGINLKKVNR